MDNKKYEVKKIFTDLFDNIALLFDEEEPRYFTYFGERLAELSGMKEGDTVLDVATGKGASLFPASKGVGENGRVLGIDISEEMVKMTSQEISSCGIKNVEVSVMDAENLSLPDEYFNYILCGFGIFFFPDYKRALYEFKRVLKVSGKCCVTTFLRKNDEEANWVKELLTKYKSSENEDKGSEVKLNSPEFDTISGLYNVLSEAGFTNIEVLSEEKEFIYKDENGWWKKQWSQATRLSLEKLTEENLSRYKEEAFERLRARKKTDGIHFKIPVIYAFGTK